MTLDQLLIVYKCVANDPLINRRELLKEIFLFLDMRNLECFMIPEEPKA